jgi:uncharacterized protein (TIGR02271 family)
MNPSGSYQVWGEDGWQGTLEEAPRSGRNGQVALRMSDGRRVLVPASLLQTRTDGTYYLPLRADQLSLNRQGTEGETLVVPIIEETLDVQKRTVDRGGVRVRKIVYENEEVIDEPLWQEEVDVQHVAVNREVDAPTAARQDGDTLIVPIFEEELVIQKRLILREEVHITRRRTQVRDTRRVILRGEEAIVQPLDDTDAGN